MKFLFDQIKIDTFFTNRAEELLCSKGINNCILEEWEKSLKTLPRNGKKHFEPDNSWLQNIQIEKGLKNRRDLLNIERVERNSELASAEWLPSQKRALVTKRSGQDWSNFGLEKNGILYLLPEEALFLIETVRSLYNLSILSFKSVNLLNVSNF